LGGRGSFSVAFLKFAYTIFFIRRLGSRRVYQEEKKKVGVVIEKNW
jgi:hypothetical protein